MPERALARIPVSYGPVRQREELVRALSSSRKAFRLAPGSVVALGLGCLVGARLGPVVVRHAPAGPLKILISAAGVALAVKLGIDAYG